MYEWNVLIKTITHHLCSTTIFRYISSCSTVCYLFLIFQSTWYAIHYKNIPVYYLFLVFQSIWYAIYYYKNIPVYYLFLIFQSTQYVIHYRNKPVYYQVSLLMIRIITCNWFDDYLKLLRNDSGLMTVAKIIYLKLILRDRKN